MKTPLMLCFVLAMACARGDAARSNAPPSARGGGPRATTPVALAAAYDRLAAARCDQAERCGEIGADGEHSTRDACLAAYAVEAADQLEGDACFDGIDAAALSSCEQAIRSEACSAPGVARIEACHAGALCGR